jgi:hypothetical protein
VPLLLGYSIKHTDVQDGKALLQLRAEDGAEREIRADQVIAATGYKVDIERLKFLSPEIRSTVKALQGSPVLSPAFESSLPGLYFVGLAAANSFGPVMRFAFGAGFAAQTLTRAMARLLSRGSAMVQAPGVVSAGK